MDYKEKYEQALGRAKVINPGTADYEVAVKIFPELQKVEDEEIRSYLIDFVKINDGVNLPPDYAKKALAWLEKQKDHEDELEKAYKTADDVQYRKGFEDGVASVKPVEWSEEDEKMRIKILEALSAYADHVQYTGFCVNAEIIRGELMDWLKSLRPQKQQKPTWSVKDEDSLDIAIRIIQNKGDDCAGILDSDKALKWLKSLKGRLKML